MALFSSLYFSYLSCVLFFFGRAVWKKWVLYLIQRVCLRRLSVRLGFLETRAVIPLFTAFVSSIPFLPIMVFVSKVISIAKFWEQNISSLNRVASNTVVLLELLRFDLVCQTNEINSGLEFLLTGWLMSWSMEWMYSESVYRVSTP